MNIIIADDFESLRILLRMFLESKGHVVTVASDGQELLYHLKVDPSFDLVITDNQMPLLSGIQVLEFLKSKAEFKALPVIVHSLDDNVRARVEDLGGIFVSKMDSLARLSTVLETFEKVKVV